MEGLRESDDDSALSFFVCDKIAILKPGGHFVSKPLVKRGGTKSVDLSVIGQLLLL